MFFWPPKNSVKNRNPNYFFTCKSIKTVACSQISKMYFRTPFIGILVLVYYFVYMPPLTVHYRNLVSLMSVQQQTHYLFYLLSKSKHPDLSYPMILITTLVLQ